MDESMDPLVSEIFTRALELPDADRQAFLDDACGPDEELARRVRRMLADASMADEFFGEAPEGLRRGRPDEDADA